MRFKAINSRSRGAATELPLSRSRSLFIAVPASSETSNRPAISRPPQSAIFAAIEAHRAEWVALEADCSRLAAAHTPEAEAELERLTEGRRRPCRYAGRHRADDHGWRVRSFVQLAEHEGKGEMFHFDHGDDGKTKPWTFFVMHNTADALEKMTAGA